MNEYVDRIGQLNDEIARLDEEAQPHRDRVAHIERDQMELERQIDDIRAAAREAAGAPAYHLSDEQLAKEALLLFGERVIDLANELMEDRDGTGRIA